MGRTPKKKPEEKKCPSPDPRRLRSWRNNSASTSGSNEEIPQTPISRKGVRFRDLKNQPEAIEQNDRGSSDLSQFERPITRFHNKIIDKQTQEMSQLRKIKTQSTDVTGKQNMSVRKSSESKTSTPSTSRLNLDHKSNREFFIRRKRLRSEMDKDGLLEGLPILLRYPKRSDNCKTTVLNINLNSKKSNNNISLGQNEIKYVTKTISKVVPRYHTRRVSAHADDSQGFLTQTQPFPTEETDKDITLETSTFEISVPEQTNKSKSSVSQNISEAREKIKEQNKRKSASSEKNLQMKSLFKELFGSESISDTSSSANELPSHRENTIDVVVSKGSIDKSSPTLETSLQQIDLNEEQTENVSMPPNYEDKSDVSLSAQVTSQDCITTSSSCSTCKEDCNCKIIDTSTSDDSINSNEQTSNESKQPVNTNSSLTAMSGSDTQSEITAITPSQSLDQDLSQINTEDTSEASSLSVNFSTEEETSLSSCTSDNNTIADAQTYRGGVLRMFNPCISDSRLYGEYSALSCMPGSDYSLHQSVSVHVFGSTTDTDSSRTSSVYPVNSADTTQLTSLSHKRTFGGECSTQSCFPESLYSPRNGSLVSLKSLDDGPIATNNNYVSQATSIGRNIGGECSTQSLMAASVYSPRNESRFSLQSSNDSREEHISNPNNECVDRSYFISGAEGFSFGGECSTKSPILESVKPDGSKTAPIPSNDGTSISSECSKLDDLPESVSCPIESTVCLQSPNNGPDRESHNNLVYSRNYGGELLRLSESQIENIVSSPSNVSTASLQSSDYGPVCKPHNKFWDQNPIASITYGCRNRDGDYTPSHPKESISAGRSLDDDCSKESCPYESVLSQPSSIDSKDDGSVCDYPTNSADTQQHNSFNFEITENRCLDISKVISRLTSSASDTSSSDHSDVNYLGNHAQIEHFTVRVDSLPLIGDEMESDESNRLIIDLNEIFDNSLNENQSFASPRTPNRTPTTAELLESRSLIECFELKTLETEPYPECPGNTNDNENIIKDEMCVTESKEDDTGDPLEHIACPELSSGSKSNSSDNSIFSLKLEPHNSELTKSLRSGSRPHKKSNVKLGVKNRKSQLTSSSRKNLKATNTIKAEVDNKLEKTITCTNSKKPKSKKSKDKSNSKTNVKKQGTPKIKDGNNKSKAKLETPSKRKNNKKKTDSVNKTDSSRSETSQGEQRSEGEQPDKRSIKSEIKKTPKKKTREETPVSSSTQPSDDNDLIPSSDLTTPKRKPSSESRRRHERGSFSQLFSNESLEVHAKTLWCSENRWAVCKLLGCNDSDDIEEAMDTQWEFISPKVKLKYFSRARYALLDEDKHSMRRNRRSSENVCKKEDEDDAALYSEALRRTVPVHPPVKNLSDTDRFIRLKPNKQRDILKRWLKFYQKMLSRRDYSNFLVDFEQALYHSRQSDPKSTPTSRPKSNDMEVNHRRILFECMKRIKPQIITNCSEKYLIRRTELNKQYSDIIWTLLNNDSSHLVPGCRSNRLEETLKDLLELEEGGHVDVRGQAAQTQSYTCILNELNTDVQLNVENTHILDDLPEVQNTELYEQILENLTSHDELPLLDLEDFPGFNYELCHGTSGLPHGDGSSNTPETVDQLHSNELIENNIREILHQEVIDAFIRSNESSTKSCCDLDSPSCILSTWIAAEYNSLPNIFPSPSTNDDVL